MFSFIIIITVHNFYEYCYHTTVECDLIMYVSVNVDLLTEERTHIQCCHG